MLEVTIASFLLLGTLAIFLGGLGSGLTTSTYASQRNKAIDDLRLSAAAFAKDARQTSRVRSATQTQVVMDTYSNGSPVTVTWGVSGTNLVRTTSTSTRTYVVNLTADSQTAVFDLKGEVDPSKVNRIGVVMVTQPNTRYPAIEIDSEVELRNVE